MSRGTGGAGLRDAWVFDAVRTARGKARDDGALHGKKPIELVAHLLWALGERNGLASDALDDVVLGCVTAVGDQGANLAKIAALYAELDPRVGGMTVNRFCASGLDACAHAAMAVMTGSAELVAAGGVECMSRVPIFSDRGAWFADPQVAERVRFMHMGVAADLLATRAGLSREVLDAYAVRSHRRAAAAREGGVFAGEIVAVEGFCEDELIRPGTSLEKLARFPPSFVQEGAAGADALALAQYPELDAIHHVHHVGTSPAMADGASLLLIGERARGEALGLKSRARIRAVAHHSVEPVLMLTANVESTRKVLARAGLEVCDVDLFEVNESFAAVPLHYQAELGIDTERLNVHGGAIALGHPLGATGGVLLSTLLAELEARGGKWGVASICGGAGVATSVLVERPS